MLLQDLFPIKNIKVGLESEDRDEVLEELVDVLAGATADKLDRSAIVEALRVREAKMSTGIKRGMALPHCMIAGLPATYGVLGISKTGVDFESLDGERAYLFFLLVSPPSDFELHLRTLQRLATLLEDSKFSTELLSSRDASGAWALLKRSEMILLGQD